MSHSQAQSNKNQQQTEELHNPLSWPDLLARWVVLLIAIPVDFIGSLLSQFLKSNGAGSPILGFLALGMGTILSADSIWQTLFKGTPIFWWYEFSWIGWSGWLTLPFNLIFWISIAIAYLIIRVEAWTLRGVSPDKARSDYQNSLKYELPKKPQGRIDLTGLLWKRYKRSGMSKYRNSGLIALLFWTFDIWTTFAGRWPWRYESAFDIICCFGYNIFAMAAGEIAYGIWKDLKREAAQNKLPSNNQ